jgi:hypothetical protein
MSNYIFQLTHPRTKTTIRIRMYVVWTTNDEGEEIMIMRWEELPEGKPPYKLMLQGGLVYWLPASGVWTLCKDVMSQNFILKIDAPSYIGLDDMTEAYHGSVPGKIQLNLDASDKHKLPSTGWEWHFVGD